ncbi:unnamed protein product [Rhizoctonia solani]|uniref:CNH domain-containing protein n=1 Tax=Rhizoctonia solani TaxID=456999 RepID=A0A8H3HAG5_9AGAM|nr:unnamed protein product [Rhizoctonia solani]
MTSYDTFANGPRYPNATTERHSTNDGYQLTVSYLGKEGFSLVLWAPTFIAREKWVERIKAQKEVVRQRNMIFDTHTLNEGVLLKETEINCAVPYDNGRRVAYGTNDGVYIQSFDDDKLGKPIKKIDLQDVKQVDILGNYNLLIVLSERSVLTFPLDALDKDNPMECVQRVTSNASFFRVGHCLRRTFICTAKISALRSTIKVLEPIDPNIRARSKSTFQKLFQGGDDRLKTFKEFYIVGVSCSIQFLKTKLCIACETGFEILDIETLDIQSLLDPADISLDFVHHHKDFYYDAGSDHVWWTEFAFYVDKSGWRSKKDFIIRWKGNPTASAFHHPYVIAFNPEFVEIWHVEFGNLVQVIQGDNLRVLFVDNRRSTMPSSHAVYQQPYGQKSSYDQHDEPPSYELATHSSQGQGHERDKVILFSDNKVVELRAVPPPPLADASVSTNA